MKSIIQENKECFICRNYYGIEGSPDDIHHCLGGCRRILADQDGLWVYLCRHHHTRLHDFGEFKHQLQIEAQKAFESKYSHDEWMGRYGKNYI